MSKPVSEVFTIQRDGVPVFLWQGIVPPEFTRIVADLVADIFFGPRGSAVLGTKGPARADYPVLDGSEWRPDAWELQLPKFDGWLRVDAHDRIRLEGIGPKSRLVEWLRRKGWLRDEALLRCASPHEVAQFGGMRCGM
jgi:hypothetical protein